MAVIGKTGMVDRILVRLGRIADNNPTAAKALKAGVPILTAGITAGMDVAASFGDFRASLLISVPTVLALTAGVGKLFSNRTELAQKRADLTVARKEAEEGQILLTELEEAKLRLQELGRRNTVMAQVLSTKGIKAIEEGVPFDGRNTLVRKLGQGGMAVALLVFDTTLKTNKVFKLPLPNMVASKADLDRFTGAEAQSMLLINHPRVVRFFDLAEMEPDVYEALVGEPLNRAENIPAKIPYINMEFVDAPTMDHVIWQEGKFTPARALRLAIDIATTLQEVSRKGIIHRDLKPGNVFLLKDEADPSAEIAKISDFGLAKKKTVENMADPQGFVPQLTTDKIAMGSPENMAPEQWMATEVDLRTDQYALGTILCEMMTGLPPFGRADQNSLMAYGQNVLRGNLPKEEILKKVDLIGKGADRWWSILSRMLAASPEARYQKWEDCIREMEELLRQIDNKKASKPDAPSPSKTKILTSLKPEEGK